MGLCVLYAMLDALDTWKRLADKGDDDESDKEVIEDEA